MAEPLKNLYNEGFITTLSARLSEADETFNQAGFKNAIFNQEWEQFELKARTYHIADQLHTFLNHVYSEQIRILLKVAPHFSGYTGTIFPTFVEKYGLDQVATSLKALEEFTKHSTSEFAIRPFLIADPNLISVLHRWSKSKNYHVRRLASEGCRPLLPWAMKLQNYVDDPTPLIPILETLKNDSEDYVYRSVANNLNDISKHHPALVLKLCKEWINESDTTKWVAKHALRTLLKKGNQSAMQLFGFGSIKAIEKQTFRIQHNKIRIGNQSTLEIAITNHGSKAKFRLEYTVGYLKKNGTHNEKVFQLRETEVQKNDTLEISKKIDFKNLSTRTHYPGSHYIDLKINGVPIERITFELTE